MKKLLVMDYRNAVGFGFDSPNITGGCFVFVFGIIMNQEQQRGSSLPGGSSAVWGVCACGVGVRAEYRWARNCGDSASHTVAKRRIRSAWVGVYIER